jgi:hypothetical protein
MTCVPIANELSSLQGDRRELRSVIDNLHGPGRDHAEEQLANLDAEIARTQSELDLCLAKEAQEQNPVPQRITGTVDHIRCHRARKEVDHDEPYLLIAAHDMVNTVFAAGGLSLRVPNVRVVKVGPWAGVDRDETHHAWTLAASDRPPFWDLDGLPRTIAAPQDVVFLVALMENDGSSPDTIRGAVQDALRLSQISNLNRAYAAYVNEMISIMTAAIESSRGLTALPSSAINRDDLIGNVQQLALTPADLAALNRLEPVNKKLTFIQTRANGKIQNHYDVTFSFTV